MGKRRDGRLAAVQCLFAHDLNPKLSTEEQAAFWELHQVKGAARDFAASLIDGILAERDRLDAEITPLLENFSFDRLAAVDRNVMRLAAYELLHADDLPTPVILNEAIDVARMLGTGGSQAFVNGVLNSLAQRLRPQAAKGVNKA
jgi:N utilization substance protein B